MREEGIPTNEEAAAAISRAVQKLSRIDHFLDKEDLKNVMSNVLKSIAEKEWSMPAFGDLDEMSQLWVSATFQSIPISDQSATRQFVNTKQSPKIGVDGSPLQPPPQLLREFSPSSSFSLSDVNSFDVGIVDRWDFLPTTMTHDQLVMACYCMFNDIGVISEFGLDSNNLIQFITSVKANYRPNPYHNWMHAIDVFQVIYMLLKHTTLREYLQPVDTLILMLGSLCHDLDHPGLNNVYQVNSQSALALLYNDASVLENHHASLAFQLLSKSENNVIGHFPQQLQQEIRKFMISEVLATDMIKHFDLVTMFTSHLSSGKPTFSKESKEDRQLLLEYFLHSADISNLIRPLQISRIWSDLLFEEYLQQGDEEKKNGLPVSPYMDRNSTDQIRMSINFVDFIGLPLFGAISKAFPEIKFFMDRLKENRAFWAERKSLQSPSIAPSVVFTLF